MTSSDECLPGVAADAELPRRFPALLTHRFHRVFQQCFHLAHVLFVADAGKSKALAGTGNGRAASA